MPELSTNTDLSKLFKTAEELHEPEESIVQGKRCTNLIYLPLKQKFVNYKLQIENGIPGLTPILCILNQETFQNGSHRSEALFFVLGNMQLHI